MGRIHLVVALFLLLTACKRTDFDNPATLTNEEALARIRDLGLKLTTSSVQTAFNTSTSSAGVHFSLLADQTTNTNRNSEWWDFAKEARIRLNNNVSYRGAVTWNTFYNNFYQANLDATLALDMVQRQGKKLTDAQGKDRTADCRVAAYFAKGVAQGYLGLIFDRGLIVDDAGLTTRSFPHAYSELVKNGVALLDTAIELASAHESLRFDFLQGIVINRADFIALSNSLAARILAGLPRDQAEAATLGAAHWQKVLSYAEKGLSTDLLLSTNAGGYYNQLVSFLTQRNSDGSGWLPPDIKIPYLADNTGQTPNYYPATGILGAITSHDQRFYQYFGYTPSFGILMESRGRGLFSNYFRKRWYNNANTLNTAGAINPYFLAEELRLLKAESRYWLQDYAGAAALLNDPAAARKAKGDLADVPPLADSLKHALHYEYAIEIDGAGSVINPFAFMRRHNLLIGGTPTEYPLPQDQLDLVKQAVYTFGGKDNAGEKGAFGETATAADNGWKKSQ